MLSRNADYLGICHWPTVKDLTHWTAHISTFTNDYHSNESTLGQSILIGLLELSQLLGKGQALHNKLAANLLGPTSTEMAKTDTHTRTHLS